MDEKEVRRIATEVCEASLSRILARAVGAPKTSEGVPAPEGGFHAAVETGRRHLRSANAAEARVQELEAWKADHELYPIHMSHEAHRQMSMRVNAAESRVQELETEHRAALEALGPIGGTGLVGMVIATRARAATAEGECKRLEKEVEEAKRDRKALAEYIASPLRDKDQAVGNAMWRGGVAK